MKKNHSYENAAGIKKSPANEFYPVSLQQEGVYLQSVIDPGNTVWNTSHSWRYKGRLNIGALKKAVRELIHRQASLRTNFRVKEEKIFQFIHEDVSLDSIFQLSDLSSYPEGQREKTAMSIEEKEAVRPYDLNTGPLIRFNLVRFAEDDHLLIIGKHHIISDVTSRQVILKELADLYNAYDLNRPHELEPLEIQYYDYAAWQRGFLESPYYRDQKEYWLNQLPGTLPLLNLPTDFPRDAASRTGVSTCRIVLEHELTRSLRTFALRRRVSFSTVFLLAFYILLNKHTAQADMIIGAMFGGRNVDKKKLNPLIGLFANRVAVRLDMNDHFSIKELLKEADKQNREAYLNQDFLFEDLVRTLQPERTIEHAPVFQAAFNLVKVTRTDVQFHGLTRQEWRGFQLDTNIALQYDLSLMVRDEFKKVILKILYPVDLFKKETVEKMLSRYMTILQDMVKQPGEKLGGLEIISEEEKRQIIYEFNNTGASFPYDKTIDALFEEQAAKVGDGVAVIGRAQGAERMASVSYKELNIQSNRLAYWLMGKGVEPGNIVGLMLERSVEMVTGILGILKAGGAYLPIDPDYPEERKQYMLKDSGAGILLTAGDGKEKGHKDAKTQRNAKKVFYNITPLRLRVFVANFPGAPEGRGGLAYVIYTSGSTGKPKGTVITHKNVVRLMINDKFNFDFNGKDVWTMFHSYCFDFSVWEMYGALLYGGRVIVIPGLTARDTVKFREVLKNENVTVLNQTPSAFNSLIAEELKHKENVLKHIRWVIFGGEALKPGKLRQWKEKYPGMKLINMYGITETTVHVTYKEIGEREIALNESNIGKPIPTLSTYVMDANMKLVPAGVPGELFVGGEGVAPGYLNRAELTALKFLENRYKSGERFYKSGDLVRWLPGGDLEYLGRIDFQVKIRGFRIELGEIESALNKYPGIDESIVLSLEGQNLCAYVAGKGGLDVPQLREHLSSALPRYMIPSYFVPLEKMPLTANGKIDRRALPKPAADGRIDSGAVYEAPRDEVQEKMAAVWREVLGLEKIGIDDNFFVIGGDSIKAIQIASRLGAYGYQSDIAALFKDPTIRRLSKYVKKIPVPGQVQRPLDLDSAELETIYDQFEDTDKNIAAIYPLNPMQQGMLFHHLYEPGSRAYIVQINYLLEGEIDNDVFRKSCEKLVERHDVLRTVFIYKNLKRPMQVVLKTGKTELHLHDIARSLEKEKEIDDITAADRSRRFDLSAGMPVRFTLIKTAGRHYLLLFTFHHIIMDGWSANLVLADFIHFYRGIRQGKPAAMEDAYPYSASIRWLEQQDSRAAHDYWRHYLSGFQQATRIESLALPDGSRGGHRTNLAAFRRRLHTVKIAKETRDRLQALANRMELTLNNVLQGVWSVLLYRYSGSDDVVFGNVISGRNIPVTGVEKIVGLFVNTIPLRVKINAGQPFVEMVKQIQANLMESQCYATLSLADVQAHTAVEGPLLEHLYVYENYPVNKEIRSPERIEKTGFKIAKKFDIEHTDYHLNVVVIPREDLLIRFRYNENVYPSSFTAQLAAHVENIIQQIVLEPDRLISNIEIVTKEEKRKLLYEFNDTAADYPKNKTIHQLFEEKAKKAPDNAALAFGGMQLSYGELNNQSNRLAHQLKEKGVQPDIIVGIMLERSVEMIIGILGILKAGGAYLPIDPNYPEERKQYMLKDSGTKILLSKSFVGVQGAVFQKSPLPAGGNLAYVIYTSGTTGRPKGVLIGHRNVVRLLFNDDFQFAFGSGDVWTMFHSYCFDFSVWEMYGALLYGGKLIVVPGMKARDTVGFLEILKKQQVTVLNQTPSAFYQLMAAGFGKNLCIGYIIFGGEALSPAKLREWREAYPAVKLVNMYGITETTVHVTYKEIGETETALDISNIGKPIPTLTVYVLDSDGKLVPPGVPGELCVGGDGVGRGYLNRVELTAAKFGVNPYKPAGRIYRSGDLGKISADGDIQYLGRIDNQVKIRGFRVELGEIEALLNKHPAVDASVVTAQKDGAGAASLCAYVAADETLTVEQLRDYLAKELPGYMIPSYFVPIDHIPLTANGKVDRKSLPAPDQSIGTGVKYEKPTNEIEERLALIWQELLNSDKIGIHDDFFHSGGHSLKAIQLSAYIKRDFNVDIPLKEIFAQPVLQDLGRIIAAGKYKKYNPIKRVKERPYYPVTPMQKRMYIIRQLNMESTAYNIYRAYIIKGPLDRDRVGAAFKALVARHDVFRTSFWPEEGGPVQKIADAAGFDFHLDVVSSAAKIDSAGTLEMIKAFIRPFDLKKAPLFRVKLVGFTPGEHLLVMDMHHMISDFTSMEILVRDFLEAYKGKELTPPSIRYRDYAVWKGDELDTGTLKNQEEYWLSRFSGEIPVLDLPTDYPRPAFQDDRGDRVIVETGKELTVALNKVASESGATLYMVLLAAYNVLLAKFTGGEDIVVGAPVSNRPQLELNNIIGIFLNTLAFRNKPAAGRIFQEFLQEVKESVLHAFDNQDYQFEDLVEKLDIERDLSRSPLFDTLFNLINAERIFDKSIKTDGLILQNYRFEEPTVKYDITIAVSGINDKLKIACLYRTTLFKKSTIEYLLGEYLKLLKEIVLDPGKELKGYKIFGRDGLKVEQRIVRPVVPFEEFDKVEMNRSIVQRFEKQVEKYPTKLALKIGNSTMTYETLNRQANHTARAILERKSIKSFVGVQGAPRRGEPICGGSAVRCSNHLSPPAPIALLFGADVSAIAAILGVLKAGGCYFPLDPDHPEERLIFMLKDAGARLMVTDKKNLPLAQGLIEKTGLTIDIIDIDALEEDRGQEAANPNLSIAPGQPAYILYTSGSTGRPKGVVQDHKNVMHFIANYTNDLHIGPSDKLTLFSSYCFDAAVLDIFGALLNGATLCYYNLGRGSEGSLEKFAQWLKDEEITIYHSMPTMFRYFTGSLAGEETFPLIRLVVLGGEAVFRTEVDGFRRFFSRECIFVNNFGTTESNNVLQYFIDKDTEITRNSVPVGYPLGDIEILLLNESGEETSVYETGEIIYKSRYLTPGYWNLPAETGSRLVNDPLTGSGRVFRSGDLGRLLPGGTIEYMGRNDGQIKIRGYRIESNEIEIQLDRNKNIKNSVVTLVKDEDGEHRLAAYYVPREGTAAPLTREELRDYLQQRLPGYMVPAYFVPLEKIPLTPTGKTAVKLLPEPGKSAAAEEEYLAPANETEKRLVNIWQEILKVEKIGIKDNFFQLGGHSLRAMNLADRIHKTFAIEIPLREIFDKPFIVDMARRIQSEEEKKRKLEQILQQIEGMD